MMENNISELLESFDSGKAGDSKRNNIDKNGLVYHTTQRTWGGLPLFNSDIARYRHQLLCELCIRFNVTIIYSIVMPTHTHDVFLARGWDDISHVMQALNVNLTKYVGHRYPRRKGLRMFSERPQYTVVKEMLHMFFLGKYVEDNVSSLEKEGRKAPYSCFWMFEEGHFPPPYNGKIYEKLFGISPKELYEFFKSHSKKEVWYEARRLFGGWTSEVNDRVFKANPDVPWISP